MKVLLLGGGGREHALAWALSKSPRLKKLYALPGSDAVSRLAECLKGDPKDPDLVARLCKEKSIDLLVIGPEDPLAAGVADAARAAGVNVFGPNKAAARLEWSKAFAKDFMIRHGIPTAEAASVSSMPEAETALKRFGDGVVIKADGLAAGKGVTVCSTHAEALAALRDCLEAGRFGAAGRSALIEERMEGREVSYMGLCDGQAFLALPPSSDHKRLQDGDQGPNTGGMGVIAPTPYLDEVLRARIEKEVVAPVLAGLKKDGLDFRGLLYCGLMLTPSGPKVLEFNTRFGDPETQAVLPLVDADVLDLLDAAAKGRLTGRKLPWKGAAVCVVLASAGYPGVPKTGLEISGLNAVSEEEALVFHAGTKSSGSRWSTQGGRVLGIVGLGADLAAARKRAYGAIDKIGFEGAQMRRDIAAQTTLEKAR